MSDDPWFRAGQMVAREIKAHESPPPQTGRVVSVETVQKTATVKIASKEVGTVSYLGSPPRVGEQVVVQKSGSNWLLLAYASRASSRGGAAGALSPRALAPNSSFVNDLAFWGHSYLDPGSASVDASAATHIAPRVFSALGLSWPHARNHGQGGSVLHTEWKTIMRAARPSRENFGDTTWQAKFGPQAFLYGANDLGRHTDPRFEGGRFKEDWKNLWRGLFSFFRAGAIYTPDFAFGGPPGSTQAAWEALFPGGKCGVTYTGSWTVTKSTDYVSVASEARFTTTSGSTIAVRLPPNYTGAPVTLYFAAEKGQNGSTSATVTHGGTSPASPIPLVTNDRVRAPSTYESETVVPSLFPVRILGIPKGDKVTSQTITVNAGTLAAGHQLTFLGWSIEASHPPLLLPANIPAAGSWDVGGPGYNTANLSGNQNGNVADAQGILARWAGYPNSIQGGLQTGPLPAGARVGVQEGDNWLRNTYNPDLAAVAAEFAPLGTVAVVDLASAMDGSVLPELYSPNDLGGNDPLHPNGLGRGVAAKAYLDTINKNPLDPRHLSAPWNVDEAAVAAASLAGMGHSE